MFFLGCFKNNFFFYFLCVFLNPQIFLQDVLSSVKGEDRPGFEAEILLLKVGLSPQAVCHKHIKA